MDKHGVVRAHKAMVGMATWRPSIRWRHGPNASGRNGKVAWARAMKGLGWVGLGPDKNELGLTALVGQLGLTLFLYFKFPNEFSLTLFLYFKFPNELKWSNFKNTKHYILDVQTFTNLAR
jgi:hypothetical protein